MINTYYKLFHLEPSGDNLTTRSRGAPSNNDPKASTDKSNKPTDGGDAKKKPSPEEINTGRIHISFEGLTNDYSLKNFIFFPTLFHFRCNNCL